MEANLKNIHSVREANLNTGRPVTAVLIPRPQHPPKVKYFPVTITVTITILIARPIHPPNSEIATDYDTNSESSSREASRLSWGNE